MPPPTLVGAYSGVGIGSVTVEVPGVRAGDVLVEVLGNAYGTGTPTVGGAGAGTRSEIGSRLGSPNATQYRNFNMATWRRDATDAGTYAFTAGLPEECMGAVLLLRNAGAVDGTPSGTAGAQSSSAPAAVQAASVTTSTDQPLLIALWGGVQFSGTIAFTPPASMVERAQPRTNQYVALLAATEVRAAGTGATGSRTATASPPPAYGWASRLIAVRGVAAPTPTGPEPGRPMLAC